MQQESRQSKERAGLQEPMDVSGLSAGPVTQLKQSLAGMTFQEQQRAVSPPQPLGAGAVQLKGAVQFDDPAWLKTLKTDLGDTVATDLHGAVTDKPYLESCAGLGSAWLKTAATHCGGGSDVAKVVNKAKAESLSAADLKDVVAAWCGSTFKDATKMATAIEKAKTAERIKNAIQYAPKFNPGKTKHGGGGPPATKASGTTEHEVKYQDTPEKKKTAYIAGGDVLHYKSGHSFADFALNSSNINRAAQSTLFPDGTDIVAEANTTLAGAVNDLKTKLASNATFSYEAIAVGSYKAGFDASGTKARMTQFYPTSGGVAIKKQTLRAIKALK